jgi:hypothetical protein
VNDLEFVSIVERRCQPLSTSDNIAVEFNGNAVALEGKRFDESLKSGGCWTVSELSALAIDQKSQREGKSITREFGLKTAAVSA